jgi:hypothetical protein
MGMRSYGTPVTGYGVASACGTVSVYTVAATDSLHISKMNLGVPTGTANVQWRFGAASASVAGVTSTAAFWYGGATSPAAYIGDWGDEGVNLGVGNSLWLKLTPASATVYYSYIGYVR